MSVITQSLAATRKNLGALTVERLLPAAARQAVGPFLFLDHIGPATLAPGQGVDVPPHPHIGLATVTYLFEGALLHRDSLGSVQEIHPGDVNWMTAGAGIAHSERTPAHLRAVGSRIHGLQFWVALPVDLEQVAPSFQHHPAPSLPRVDGRGYVLTLIAGHAWGLVSPVQLHSPLFYADLHFTGPGCFPVTTDYPERAIYLVEGSARIDGEPLTSGQVHMLAANAAAVLEADGPARLMVFGGEPLGPRRMWWNFVASTPDLISAARTRWAEGGFPDVPGETERLPLPAR
ncbi:MAG TPA: pirin family protein [Moraxellaceae bacterium]|nr:pirin family protein [Moraxellaceae bacterium]